MKKEIYATVDPTFQYPNMNPADLVQSLGLLPGWVEEAMRGDVNVQDYLDDAYGFGLYEMTGGAVESDGTYTFPGDPDLAPIALMEDGVTQVYFYPHAIIAILHNGTTFVTRMD
jgi:hypothetical protein